MFLFLCQQQGKRQLQSVCTLPTIQGESRIEELYQDSTMERLNLPCPSCTELHPIEWAKINEITKDFLQTQDTLFSTLCKRKHWSKGGFDYELVLLARVYRYHRVYSTFTVRYLLQCSQMVQHSPQTKKTGEYCL
ncbi:phage terminase large subunit family protein [Paenibacillus sp. 598K]|uniref:phage terminase large subunit family protein n=1 Tax=Paenibacillus sp. 598K TaxID=1117987 RepID=UPI0027D92E9F|nr:phage terminase large subunit family protein [Paenibacillus sp. 598K]